MEDTVVLYPSPEIGHLISMVELGKLILHRHGHQFAITVLLTTGMADSPSITSYIGSISRSHPSISFRRFPLVSVDLANPPQSHAAVLFDFIHANYTQKWSNLLPWLVSDDYFVTSKTNLVLK